MQGPNLLIGVISKFSTNSLYGWKEGVGHGSAHVQAIKVYIVEN
jgi:hypothetical protein